MSNPYPTGYPAVPGGGMMNSPHTYTGSPGPISMNQGMPSMTGSIVPGPMGPGMGGMATGMPAGMNPAMTGNMNAGMSGPMSGMGGMGSVLSSALSSSQMAPMNTGMPSTLGPPINSVMSPGMGGGMQGMPGMPSMAPGMSSAMVPMPMQFSMGPGQASQTQNAPGLPQSNGPSTTPNSSTCDSVASSQGSVQRIATPGAAPDGTTTPQSSRDINTASLCRIGQETVQDIISRTQEIFQTLKTLQPPNGTGPGANASNDKKHKVQEQLRTIRILFKRLRLIYEKCNDNSQLQGMEYTHIESLIPLKDEWDGKSEERRNSEAYRQATEEHRELMEAVVAKNKVLKDIIDHMRRIIWEINTMLMMRRS